MEDFSRNIIIVEDDIALAIDLEMIVEEMGYKVIDKVDNSDDAFEVIENQEPDLILMDIDIKGDLTGIQIAEQIKSLNIPVLFVTSFNDQAHFEKARQTNYIGYIVKPVNKFSLRSSIETAFRKMASREKKEETGAFPFNDTLFFKKRGILHRIKISSILYISADDDYTITTAEKGEFISSLRLFEIEKLLEPFSFIKVHRSHLVNINKINSIDTKKNVLKVGEHEVPVSRSNKNLIIEKIQLVR